ncbi:RHS repeat-associated protein [Acidovorax soli]|uniref:RHS repeat-associated protein n=1 Tax=Acidovorax soli TaxID=592050 RepID=A0A7X0UAV2_9BURK|nr:RHS repeat-associated core domain-containing protein [Acidovorax soli]MBB6561647.1 RHS repeat-associated protein [Acidovorax soli]
MRSWVTRLLALGILLLAGNAYANYEYNKFCIESGDKAAAATCRLAPDGFDRWSYTTGFGTADQTLIDGRSGYESEEVAFQKTMDELIYKSPGYSSMCQISYTLGEVEVTRRDTFKTSDEPVAQKRPFQIKHGSLDPSGNCYGVVDMYGGWINGTRGIRCNDPAYIGWMTDVASSACIQDLSKSPQPCDICQATKSFATRGNPILVPVQEKFEFIVDLDSGGPLPLTFARIYRSHRARDKAVWFGKYFKPALPGDMGDGWTHNHSIHLAVGPQFNIVAPVRIQMGDGSFIYFNADKSSGQGYKTVNPLHVLTKDNAAGGWIFDDKANETRYLFGRDGMLFMQIMRNGWSYAYTHSGDKLTSITSSLGRQIFLAYGDGGKLVKVTTSDQRSVTYSYANGLLTGARQSDGTVRQYLYTEAAAKLPPLLSGIVDEQGNRYSTYTYDSEGWAQSTEKSGAVDRYSVSGKSNVVDPLGTSRTYSFGRFGNWVVYQGVSKPPASSSEPKITAASANSNALIDFYYDFNYTQTRFTWDTPRRLPLTVTEAAGLSESRVASVAWHSEWRAPVTITEPGRITTYTYDSAGNTTSQSVNDAAAGVVRTTVWTYNAAGLVATETAANGAITSYGYDGLGNLTQATNALGHVDVYTYDGAGRVLAHTAPNGLLTTYAYDARGRVLTSNRGGEVSTFTYRPSGEVLAATLPAGHSITYTYDPAHRLTGWSDNRGNTGTYVLDNMGNRLSEEVRNNQGHLAWQLARSVNSLNRRASETVGTGGAPTTHTYNANANLRVSTQSVNGSTIQTSYSRDALERVTYINDPESGGTTLNYNASDAITKVTDAKSVATTYTRDAEGNPLTEGSPDSGSKIAQYDALGLPSSITNALGQATTITRDLLGRPTSIAHANGTVTTLRYDQSTTAKGYLSEIEDASGITTYQRDVHGRVVSQTQKLINNDSRTLAYSYHPTTGLLSSTTYPGGQVLQNVYDATGQLTGLTWAGQPLVSGITWSPLGQPTGWSWSLPGGSAAIPATRSYNTAGQLTATEFSSYTYDGAGRITSLTQGLMQPASTDAQASSLTLAPATWTVQYNLAGRIVGFTRAVASGAPANSATYTYDKNGNRVTSNQQQAGTTTSRTYALAGNRHTAFSQTKTGPAGTANSLVNFQYNAAGDLLSDGLRTFQYDSQERLEKVTTGTGVDAPSTQYAHNALGQRVFKTEPLFASGSGSGSTTSGKNLNNLLSDPEDQEEAEAEKDKGFIQTAYEFFTRLWSPGSSDAQKLGFAYVYGQDGTLLGEYGMGGSNSSGTTQYIYLPTANGPMPIAAIVNGTAYAVHSDHLNTPRKLTQPDGQVAWQWAYSAFGDEQPTVGAKRFTDATTNPTTGTTSIPEVTFNLRYPGQYYDKESNLHYNYFRSYSAERGRYTQADPIGLEGGFNRFGYVEGNALGFVDPYGLLTLDDIAFLTPERAASAAQYWADKQNQTGNWGYAIPGMAAALLAENYDVAMMAMCSIRGTPPRGGENAAAAVGRRAHFNYRFALGENFDMKARLLSGKRPDAVDWANSQVRELKPDNPRAVSLGERQVEGYRKELELMTNRPWTSVVDVYRGGK